MKAYKYKLYKDQDNKYLDQVIDLNGKLYNLCLSRHKRYYRLFKKFLNIYQLQKHLTKLKKLEKYQWIKSIPSDAMQQLTERLDKGYKLFFNNKKKKIKTHPPKFKSCKKYKSFTLKKAGFKLLEDNVLLINKRKYRYYKSRQIEGKIKRVTISRNSLGEYYLIITTDYEQFKMINYTGKSVGYDFGLKTFLTSSDYNDIKSPLYLINNIKKLRKLSKNFSKKKKGSNNAKRARLRLARLHKKISNQRLDFIHKTTLNIIKNYDYIFFEDLNLKALQKRFGRKINDLAFNNFLTILEQKANVYHKQIIYRDKFFPSSKICNVCGYKNQQLKLKDREWTCKACSTHLDRDRNASFNILLGGASPTARGTSVTEQSVLCR